MGNGSRWVSANVVCFVAVVLGCNRHPPTLEPPKWEPEKMSAAAMEQADKNKDGKLNAGEQATLPGLKAGLRDVDADKDRMISAAELTERLRLYQQMQTAFRAKSMIFNYQGRPLVGATVKLIPESFLKDVVEPAEGKTDESGMVMPEAVGSGFGAVRLGYYRIQVESDTVKLPAKYNTNTSLGIEVAPVSSGYESSSTATFDLR